MRIDELNKRCVKCQEYKSTSEFYLKRNRHYHSYCNDCRKKVKRNWDLEHIEARREHKKRRAYKDAEYRAKNRELLNKRSNDSYHKNKGENKLKRQNIDYKTKRRLYEKKWREDNKEWCRRYYADYLKNNPNAKIAHILRNRINKVLDGRIKHGHMEELIGCSMDFLKNHLESQFMENMSWSNHGFGDDKWNIDHKPPLASYTDLSDPTQQKEAFHWTHLSPKWTFDNISENSWYNGIRYYYKK